MSINNLYSSIKPSLNLDFANTKRLDPRITFARASTATYYDGKTFAKAEENLLTYSQDFANAAWNQINGASVTSNTSATTAPDGTETADVLLASGTSTPHYLRRTGVVVTGTHTFSVYIKAGTSNYAQLFYVGDDTSFVNFDLSAGTVGTSGGTATGSIVSAGNGWYRCISVNTATTLVGAGVCIVDSASATRAQTLTISTSVYLWGAQLEQGSFPTSYIPTTTTALTRAADAASMTGTNFSSWYRQDEGTMYAEYTLAARANKVNNIMNAVSLSDGTVNNRIRIFADSVGALEVAQQVSMLPSISLVAKVSFAYKTNDFAGSANGGTVVTDTSGVLPVISQMQIGNLITTRDMVGTIKRIAYYPRRVTNAQLVALTA